MNNFYWLKWFSELKAISQSGLTYCNNEFDKERYIRLGEIVSELTAHCCTIDISEVVNLFSLEKGYATSKLDVRSFILRDGRLLLVKERSDGLWTLPGGWADVNESPSEAVIRETKEETGYNVATKKLLALCDKLKHDQPSQWPHTYKCFFQCEIVSGEAKENTEISEQNFFDLNNLPPLSTNRVTEKQIVRLFELVINPRETQFD